MGAMTVPKRRNRPGAGRPKGEESPRKTIASFKGSAAFDAWFAGLVDHTRIPASSVIELALVAYAKQAGYKPEPPRR